MVKRSKRKNESNFVKVLLIVGFSLGILSAGALFSISPPRVSAQAQQSKVCDVVNGKIINTTNPPCIAPDLSKVCGTDANGQPVAPVNGSCPDPAVKSNCGQVSCNQLITDYINPFIKVLAALMGLIVAISVVVSAIQFSSAGGDPSKVGAAKKRLSGSLLALLAYLFMMSFLQWLLPGGIL